MPHLYPVVRSVVIVRRDIGESDSAFDNRVNDEIDLVNDDSSLVSAAQFYQTTEHSTESVVLTVCSMTAFEPSDPGEAG